MRTPAYSHNYPTMPVLVDITNLTELDEMWDEAESAPVVLYKHSSSCSISVWTMHQMSVFLREPVEGARYYRIVVQRAREVAHAITDRLGLRHESPQLIVLERGEAILNLTHFSITAGRLRQALTGRSQA